MSLLTLYEVRINGGCVRTVRWPEQACSLAIRLAHERFERDGHAVFSVHIHKPEGISAGWHEYLRGSLGFDSKLNH